METITFYSYKGGVGRTLALANTAVYLSRFGLNVCIVDFDLEAPGLHYKLRPLFPAPIERGVVDYIYEFISEKNIPDSLEDFALRAENIPESDGYIRLIPAGNVLSSKYWQKLATIDWHRLFYVKGGEGIPFFLELKERIRKELKPDFLLIDSRTGITEMSGLCTSLLPDKVVFLITNNRENIEGSRQILRAIQKAKRLKGQKHIEVNFALTRIPAPANNKEIEKEKEMIEDIKNFLNEETPNLDDRLNISEISVLHSDRELELSEDLRLNQKNVRDIPLAKDYLKLLSRNIPVRIIKSRLDGVLESVISSERLLEEPDNVQKELEALIEVYPHPQTFEKLIDFYSLRNIQPDDILEIYSDLWKISKKLSARIYSKFITMLMKVDRQKISDSHLEMVEEYLKSKPDNRLDVELKLADEYREKKIYKKALEHYLNLVELEEEKEKLLEKVFKIYMKTKDKHSTKILYQVHRELILKNVDLKKSVLEVMITLGLIPIISELFDDNGKIENMLLEESPLLFFRSMEALGRTDVIDAKMDVMIPKVLDKNDIESAVKLGEMFKKLDKLDEFARRIPDDFSKKERILRYLR